MTTLLEVDSLAVQHRSGVIPINAVDGVSFGVGRGETVGLVGESGCGKSTLGRTLLGIHRPVGGSIRFDGTDVTHARRSRALRRRLQMIFQDPLLSLNPRSTVGRIIAEPMTVHGVGSRAERRQRVTDLLDRVGLPQEAAQRLPHQFSGGQRQRIGIARALALQPDLIVCDEPVSALDLSVQAQILNLLGELQIETGLAYLFISHDLGVVHHVADRVLVMYFGRIVESGPASQVWHTPRHPYTAALLAARPGNSRASRKARALASDLPSQRQRPNGCVFQGRCPRRQQICAEQAPVLRDLGQSQQGACHFA